MPLDIGALAPGLQSICAPHLSPLMTDPVSSVSPSFSAKAGRGFGLVLVRQMVGFLQVRHALGAGMRQFPLVPHEYCFTAAGAWMLWLV